VRPAISVRLTDDGGARERLLQLHRRCSRLGRTWIAEQLEDAGYTNAAAGLGQFRPGGRTFLHQMQAATSSAQRIGGGAVIRPTFGSKFGEGVIGTAAFCEGTPPGY
jgi:hypothetical protein